MIKLYCNKKKKYKNKKQLIDFLKNKQFLMFIIFIEEKINVIKCNILNVIN